MISFKWFKRLQFIQLSFSYVYVQNQAHNNWFTADDRLSFSVLL